MRGVRQNNLQESLFSYLIYINDSRFEALQAFPKSTAGLACLHSIRLCHPLSLFITLCEHVRHFVLCGEQNEHGLVWRETDGGETNNHSICLPFTHSFSITSFIQDM